MANANPQPQTYVPVAPPNAQPGAAPQPVVYLQPAATLPQALANPVARSPEHPHVEEDKKGNLQLKLVSHSSLFYWWPVWAVGFAMALVSYFNGTQHQIGVKPEFYHASSAPGVAFFLTLFLVILITNFAARGLASVIVIMSVVLATVLLAYFGMWDEVLGWLGNLSVHVNLGAYVAFSALLFAVWALTFFVIDHMSYWLVKPGQITRVQVLGTGSHSYDTDGMVLEKHRDDIFRHWVLGLGSGDLVIQTMGANRDTIHIPNVLFIGSKIEDVQEMIATEPDSFGRATIK